ncbi:MAG: nickel-responsive transcriptional regulator NikR [Deltaproteobacteria bacterium]|jgi:CopG family nickel-responsive transcriptional regulator|nr:nickel-responsive transcriptional regulator NikR [Deltaproteobacteria bacterium]
MGRIVRFGVSLDAELLAPFDELCARRGYDNRSEAIRDLIRKALVDESWEQGGEECAGTLSLVYDHHSNDLSRRLTALQHDDHDIVVASLHVHLDHHNCLEVLILKGTPTRVRALADRLCAIRGVKHGVFSVTGTGKGLA